MKAGRRSVVSVRPLEDIKLEEQDDEGPEVEDGVPEGGVERLKLEKDDQFIKEVTNPAKGGGCG